MQFSAPEIESETVRPEPASKAKRDSTPLRLISWLSYKLNPELEQFIEQAMEHLSTWKETEGGKVLTMGKDAIQHGETINSEVELRDRLIDLVSVGNLKHKPEALFTLFRQFLTRISLPRLIHFLDLVLSQLMPVQAAWAGEEKTLWSCHKMNPPLRGHATSAPSEHKCAPKGSRSGILGRTCLWRMKSKTRRAMLPFGRFSAIQCE